VRKRISLFVVLPLALCGCPVVAPTFRLPDNMPAGMNVLTGENRETLINREGGAAVIDVGDSIRGIITMDLLTNANGSFLLGGSSGRPEVTAIFQLLVVEKTETALAGTFDFVFGPDPAFVQEFGAPAGTIIIAYVDTHNNVAIDASPRAVAEAGARDGTLFMQLGFTGADGTAAAGEGWIARGADDGGLPINPGEVVGTANFAVSRTSTQGLGGALDLTPQTSLFFGQGAEFIGGSAARGTTGLTTPWAFSSDTAITMVLAGGGPG
jgi:hypothetical protein